jgi:hypothetical protein
MILNKHEPISRNNLSILTVNYNTPDFIFNLINSIRNEDKNIEINIIDGSDYRLIERGDIIVEINNKLKKELIEANNINHYSFGYNIHHGPGMHIALSRIIRSKYVLIIDSDCWLEKNSLEYIISYLSTKNFTAAGLKIDVNSAGINVNKGYKYIHPSMMVINKYKYNKSLYNFELHGAPCLKFMLNTPDEELIKIDNIKKYISTIKRGTRNHFGMGLNTI